MGIVTADEDETETENEAPVIEDETADVPVTPSDDKEPSPDRAAAAPERKSRKDYREGKKQDWKAELRAAHDRLERESVERQRLERDFAELKGRFSERHEKDSQVDYEGKIQSLQDKANQHLANAHAAQQNPQLAKSEMNAYYATLREISRVDRQAERAKEEKERQGQQPQTQELPPQVQSDIVRLFHDFSWLRTNAQARVETDALIDSMVREGHPNSYITFKAAAAQIAQSYSLGGNGSSNGAARQRFSGVSAGESDGGSSASRVVKMGDHERRMAEARYSELPAEEAHKKWARDIGSKLARQEGR